MKASHPIHMHVMCVLIHSKGLLKNKFVFANGNGLTIPLKEYRTRLKNIFQSTTSQTKRYNKNCMEGISEEAENVERDKNLRQQ